MRVFNCDGGFGGERIDYDGFASAVFELLVGFGRFVPLQDTVVEPHVCWFRCLLRHAGLGRGLRARIAARIWPKMLRGTAISASWKAILRAWRTTRAPILWWAAYGALQ